jgi:prepilin peptidase CpaA
MFEFILNKGGNQVGAYGVTIPVVVVLAAAFVAALTDWWRFRVHNLLTLPLMCSGLAYHAWVAGWPGLGNSLLGMVFGFGVLILFFLMGGMGAGDVKLMAGVGAWLGLPLTFWVFIAASLVSGVYAVYLILAYGQVQRTWVSFRLLCLRLVALGRHLGSDQQLEMEINQPEFRQRVIPFATMMAIGIILLIGLSLYLGTNL